MNALQSSLLYIPDGTVMLSDKLAFFRKNEFIHFFNASGIIYRCLDQDKESLKFALGMFLELKLATSKILANEFDLSLSTIYRSKKKFREGCNSNIKISNYCHQSYSRKLYSEKVVSVQNYLDSGMSIRSTAKMVGISEGTIRHAIKKNKIKRSNSKILFKGPSERSGEDTLGETGVGVKRHTERMLARLGRLGEASPVFFPVEGLQKVEVLLSLPILLSQGILEVGEVHYGSLSQGFFGLRSVLLCLSFMALLRIKNPEQLKEHSPGDLGILLGLDRFPEIKTLRRKIEELGKRGKAKVFSQTLSDRWANDSILSLGYLYIDGHVRSYNERKRKIPKTHVARRRLCMPATTDFWVNDANSEPIFFVTTEANNSMLSILDNEIIPEVNRIIGRKRKVTLVFDREGWSPKSFKKWKKDGIDVLTYRKGNYELWPSENFMEVEKMVCGKKVKYKIGQRSIFMKEEHLY